MMLVFQKIGTKTKFYERKNFENTLKIFSKKKGIDFFFFFVKINIEDSKKK